MLKSGNFKFVEQEPDDGKEPRILHFESFDVEPFGYEDLKNNNPQKPFCATVKFRNVVLGTQSENVDVTGTQYRSDIVLQARSSNKSYALTQSGWFPPGFSTLDKLTYLLDRCSYNDVRAFCCGQEVLTPDRDFVEFLTKPGTCINIIPMLLEGNQRRMPSDFEIFQQYTEAMSKLGPVLPQAKFQPVGFKSIVAAKNLMDDPFLSISKEQTFLSEIASLLQSPVSKVRRPHVLSKIKLSADLHGIDRFSFVFLAAVSAAVCPQNANPAKNVLKIRANYGKEDIYNALSDLRSLKLLSGLIAIMPEQNPVFCTSDKNLALFWVGLQPKEFERTTKNFSFTLNLSETLFPGLDEGFFE